MKFSIIVPIFNVEKYIRLCIDSILCQTFKNYELILVDDGSPDACPVICDEYANNNKHVVVIHKENGGQSEARNIGIEKALGDYILFLDGDDYWLEEDLLERVDKRINKFQSDVICLNYKKVYENGKNENYFSQKKDMPTLNMGNTSIQYIIKNDIWTACAWNKVIKRSLFFESNLAFIKGITSEDIDWSARLAVAATTFDYIGTPCIGYRQRENSTSKTMTYEQVYCLYKNIDRTQAITQMADSCKKKMLMPYISYQYGTLLMNVALLDSVNQRKQMCKDIKSIEKLLEYSKSGKLILLKFTTKIFSIKGTVEMLRLMKGIRWEKKA